MLRLFLILIMCFYDAISHPAPCTEDSHCPSGFFCEESHFCRECLRCDEFKHEAPQPPVPCIKSVVQCGACVKGLLANVLGGDELRTDCVADEEHASHAYLPVYAWAAIAVGIILMVITLGLFLKMRAFNVAAYSSSTSVRAADMVAASEPLAPPPYYLPSSSIPLNSAQDNAPEIQRLVESPQSCKKPSPKGPVPREVSTSQTARVFNQPTFEHGPQNLSSSTSPEGNELGVVVTPTREAARLRESQLKLDCSKPNDITGKGTSCEDFTKTACGKDQDSNNNRSSSEGSCRQGSPSGAPRDSFIMGGPSFVINVVENINSLRLRNDANARRSDSS